MGIGGSDKFLFTHQSLLEFGTVLGIPSAFLSKIPNELAIQNFDALLSENNVKLNIVTRDNNVCSNFYKESILPVEGMPFLEAGEDMLKTHSFHEASFSDGKTSFLFMPRENFEINPYQTDDIYSVGLGFHLGYSPNIALSTSWTQRHACGNIAQRPCRYDASVVVEKLKKEARSGNYQRLIERSDKSYYEYCKNLEITRLQEISGILLDVQYDEVFKSLSGLLGREVAWSLIDVTEEDHKCINANISAKKKRKLFNAQTAEEVLEIPRYEVFNRITAAAKGYSGDARVELQNIGGALLHFNLN